MQQDPLDHKLDCGEARHVLKYLQRGLQCTGDWMRHFLEYENPYNHIIDPDEKCALLVLSGVEVPTHDRRYWVQKATILKKITTGCNIDMKTLTMDQVRKLVTAMFRCEPVYDSRNIHKCNTDSIESLKTQLATVEKRTLEEHLDETIRRGNPDFVKWLLCNTNV